MCNGGGIDCRQKPVAFWLQAHKKANYSLVGCGPVNGFSLSVAGPEVSPHGTMKRCACKPSYNKKNVSCGAFAKTLLCGRCVCWIPIWLVWYGMLDLFSPQMLKPHFQMDCLACVSVPFWCDANHLQVAMAMSVSVLLTHLAKSVSFCKKLWAKKDLGRCIVYVSVCLCLTSWYWKHGKAQLWATHECRTSSAWG